MNTAKLMLFITKMYSCGQNNNVTRHYQLVLCINTVKTAYLNSHVGDKLASVFSVKSCCVCDCNKFSLGFSEQHAEADI